jgi:hypothetical protein
MGPYFPIPQHHGVSFLVSQRQPYTLCEGSLRITTCHSYLGTPSCQLLLLVVILYTHNGSQDIPPQNMTVGDQDMPP